MNMPTKWSIRCILNHYYNMMAKMVNIYKDGKISFEAYYSNREECEKLYTQAIKLIFSKESFGKSDIMLLETFNTAVEEETVNRSQGEAYYISFEGEELGPFNWDDIYTYPEDTVYVVWDNKGGMNCD